MVTSARRPLVAGNWKLHHGRAASVELSRAVAQGVGSDGSVEVVLAPVFTSLFAVHEALEGSGVGLSGQDVHWDDSGAFTGEISAPLLKDAGCTHCIVGHSERRQLFDETDDKVRRKLGSLLVHGLTPIVCIGETLQEREAGKTLDVVLGQLDAALETLNAEALPKIVLAYEPVWAIGTGKVASPQDAQEVHAAIRQRLASRGDAAAANAVRILYGGSVKSSNAADLLSQSDIDGALVGGASLEAASFLPIIEAARQALA